MDFLYQAIRKDILKIGIRVWTAGAFVAQVLAFFVEQVDVLSLTYLWMNAQTLPRDKRNDDQVPVNSLGFVYQLGDLGVRPRAEDDLPFLVVRIEPCCLLFDSLHLLRLLVLFAVVSYDVVLLQVLDLLLCSHS